MPLVVPFNETLCPASPSLQWAPWASVPHLLSQSLPQPSVLCSAKTANCPSRIASLSLAFRYLACSLRLCPVSRLPQGSRLAGRRKPPPSPRVLVFGSIPRLLPHQQGDSRLSQVPELPPKIHAPSQTPVVSRPLAFSCPGLLPSARCTASAFPFTTSRKRLSFCPRLYIFRGSVTRPAPSLLSAPHTHRCNACGIRY